MKQDKVLSMLGLANRAGKIISGEELIIKGIRKGKILLVILSEDISENTRKKISDKCLFYKIPYYTAFKREQLGHAIGKSSRVAIGITERNFVKELEKVLE